MPGAALEHRRLISLVVAVLGIACGEAAVESTNAKSTGAPVAPVDLLPPGDPLLASARASIDHGVLAAESRAAILDSTAPVHARARALLEALQPAPPAVLPSTPPPEAPPVAVAPPTIVSPEKAPAAAPASSPPRAKPTLEKLSMKATSRGASLSITAGRGVLVGVANQPEAGVVRLVLDDVAAAAKVLGSRPSVTGARVRDVSAGPKSVRITLELDDGWRFGGVSRTSTGARVDLVGP